MNAEIVIARYNENLNWLKLLDPNIKITIYNKGKSDIEYSSIALPNVGRESHTYLYHLVNNYDNLADITIFCQGDSIFHSPDFIELVNTHRTKFEPIQPLSAYYWPPMTPDKNINGLSNDSTPTEIMLKNHDMWIENCNIHVEYMNDNLQTQYPLSNYENHINTYTNYMKKIYKITNPMNFAIDRYNLPVDKTKPKKLYPFCFAGLFAVKRHVILDKCVDYYNNMLNILLYDKHSDYYNNKIGVKKSKLAGHSEQFDLGILFERLWLVIFNYEKYNSHFKPLLASKYELEEKKPLILNNCVKFRICNKIFDLFIHIYTNKEQIQITMMKKVITIKINNKKHTINISNSIFESNKKKIKLKLINNMLKIRCNHKNVHYIQVFGTKLTNVTLYNISKKWHWKDYNLTISNK